MKQICGPERYEEIKNNFKKSEETKKKISNSKLGKKRPPEVCKKMSERMIGNIPWNKGKPFLQGKNNPHYGKPNEYYRGHGRKKRKDLNNQFFRSNWEANFARILNHLKIKWEYEPTRFKFENCTYCPDFKIYDKKIGIYYIEIVGFFDDCHKKKLSLMNKFYPTEQLQVINNVICKDLKNKYSQLLPN